MRKWWLTSGWNMMDWGIQFPNKPVCFLSVSRSPRYTVQHLYHTGTVHSLANTCQCHWRTSLRRKIHPFMFENGEKWCLKMGGCPKYMVVWVGKKWWLTDQYNHIYIYNPIPLILHLLNGLKYVEIPSQLCGFICYIHHGFWAVES